MKNTNLEVRNPMKNRVVLTAISVVLATVALSACGAKEVSVEEAKSSCAKQLKQADIRDIRWAKGEQTSKGFLVSGTGVEGDKKVDVSCEVDSDGIVRKSTSGTPY